MDIQCSALNDANIIAMIKLFASPCMIFNPVIPDNTEYYENVRYSLDCENQSNSEEYRLHARLTIYMSQYNSCIPFTAMNNCNDDNSCLICDTNQLART